MLLLVHRGLGNNEGLSVQTLSFQAAEEMLPLCVIQAVLCDGYEAYKNYDVYLTKPTEELEHEMYCLQ